MTTFNPENYFQPLLANIHDGQTKTTHQLRLILEDLAEKYKVSPLSLLVSFREWLLNKNIELSTTDGVVGLSVI